MNASGRNCRENWDRVSLLFIPDKAYTLGSEKPMAQERHQDGALTQLIFLFYSLLCFWGGKGRESNLVWGCNLFTSLYLLGYVGWNIFWEVQEGRKERGRRREGITAVERQNCKPGLQILPLPSGSLKRHPYGQQHASKITWFIQDLLSFNHLSFGSF